MELKINPLFRDKIPALTSEEFERLEQNILKDGKVREPIVVWNGTIIDGHNRYKIIQKHPEIPFNVEEMNFSDDYEAIAWMCANQIGRRNLSDIQIAVLRGEYAIAFNKSKGAQKGNNNANSETFREENESPKIGYSFKQNRSSGAIAAAKAFNSRPTTVDYDVMFVKGLNKAEEVSPGFKEKILSGEVKVSKAKVAELRKADANDRKDQVDEMLGKKPKSEANREKEIKKNMKKAIASITKDQSGKKVDVEQIINVLESTEDEFQYNIKSILERNKNEVSENREKFIAFFEGTVHDINLICKEFNLK